LRSFPKYPVLCGYNPFRLALGFFGIQIEQTSPEGGLLWIDSDTLFSPTLFFYPSLSDFAFDLPLYASQGIPNKLIHLEIYPFFGNPFHHKGVISFYEQFLAFQRFLLNPYLNGR